MSMNPFPSEDISLTDITDLMSTSGLDNIWLDLDGDLIPETMIQIDGPFEVDPGETPPVSDIDASYDDAAFDTAYSDGGLVGEPISVLLPWEAEPGSTDVWALPEDGGDWTDFSCYDPMTVPSDWTVDGYTDPGGYDDGSASTTAPFTVDDNGGFSDPNGYYDSSGYYDTAGYYDTTGYYDGGDGFDPSTYATDSWDSWDTGVAPDTSAYDGSYSDPTAYYDPSSFDPSGYDTSSYDTTSFDTTGGDGAVEDTYYQDLDVAADSSAFYTEQANDNYDASWDLWNQSVDADLNGDSMAAYELNSMSLDANAAGNESWTYADQSWDFDSSSAYDTTSYDTTSYDTTSYDTTSYDTTSYDASSDW